MKNAWVDADGILIGWGYTDSHMHYDCIPVAHDFALEPLKWRTVDGITWEPYTHPESFSLSAALSGPKKRWFQFWRK